MKIKLVVVLIGAAILLPVFAPVFAHHGRSNYDVTGTVTIKGVVTQFDWANPHALIYLDVKNDEGKMEKWIAETNSPNTLSRQGWARDTVKVGDEVTLVGHRVKGGGLYLNFSKISWPDGRVLSPAVQN